MLPESLFVTLVVVAIVQLIKYIREKAWDSVATIISAALVGGLAGYFGVDSLNVTSGIIAGLTASGLITVAQKFAGR